MFWQKREKVLTIGIVIGVDPTYTQYLIFELDVDVDDDYDYV